VPFYPRTWEQAVDDIRPWSTGGLMRVAGQDVEAAGRVLARAAGSRATQQRRTNRKLAAITPVLWRLARA